MAFLTEQQEMEEPTEAEAEVSVTVTDHLSILFRLI